MPTCSPKACTSPPCSAHHPSCKLLFLRCPLFTLPWHRRQDTRYSRYPLVRNGTPISTSLNERGVSLSRFRHTRSKQHPPGPCLGEKEPEQSISFVLSDLLLAYSLAQPARSLEIPYRVPKLHRTTLSTEKIGNNTGPLGSVSEKIRQEILDGATVLTRVAGKPLAPHGRHLARDLPLISCGRDKAEGNRAVALMDPAGFSRILIGVCLTNAMSTRPEPVSNREDPSLSASDVRDPRNGSFVLEGSCSICRNLTRRGTPESGPAPGLFILAIDERTDCGLTL